MRRDHAFVGDPEGNCLGKYQGMPCGWPKDAEIHTGKADRRDPVRIDGRRKVPWAELPISGKIAVTIMVAGGGAVFVSACLALSWAMLRMGGVVG